MNNWHLGDQSNKIERLYQKIELIYKTSYHPYNYFPYIYQYNRFSFGTTPAAPASTGGFSFGATPAAAPASTGGFSFGATPAATTAPATTGGFSFGTTPAATAAPATSGGFSFGAAPTAAPASTGGFSFGATPAVAPSSTCGFSFGATPAAAPAAGGFSFGTTPAAPAAGGFSFGQSTPAPGTNTTMPQAPVPPSNPVYTPMSLLQSYNSLSELHQNQLTALDAYIHSKLNHSKRLNDILFSVGIKRIENTSGAILLSTQTIEKQLSSIHTDVTTQFKELNELRSLMEETTYDIQTSLSLSSRLNSSNRGTQRTLDVHCVPSKYHWKSANQLLEQIQTIQEQIQQVRQMTQLPSLLNDTSYQGSAIRDILNAQHDALKQITTTISKLSENLAELRQQYISTILKIYENSPDRLPRSHQQIAATFRHRIYNNTDTSSTTTEEGHKYRNYQPKILQVASPPSHMAMLALQQTMVQTNSTLPTSQDPFVRWLLGGQAPPPAGTTGFGTTGTGFGTSTGGFGTSTGTSGFSFGAKPAAPASTGGFSFGATPAAAPTTTGGFSFGTTPAAAPATTSGFSFGASASTGGFSTPTTTSSNSNPPNPKRRK